MKRENRSYTRLYKQEKNEEMKERYRRKDPVNHWILDMDELVDWRRMRREHGIYKTGIGTLIDCDKQ